MGPCLREIAQARVRYGYRKMRVLLNREGWGARTADAQRELGMICDPEWHYPALREDREEGSDFDVAMVC